MMVAPCRSATTILLSRPWQRQPRCALSSLVASRRTRPAAPARPNKLSRSSDGLYSSETRRAASSVATPNPTSASTTASQTQHPAQDDVLDWNTFFKLRKVRRRYNLAASVSTALMSTSAGVSILSSQDLDFFDGQMFGGLHPFVVLGLATAGSGLAGWLVGPFFGNALFGLSHRRYVGQVAVKEKEFYNRIKRYRVDPSSGSVSNPVPDYYGEKIGSVSGYRQWLKDQRAYNKKRQTPL